MRRIERECSRAQSRPAIGLRWTGLGVALTLALSASAVQAEWVDLSPDRTEMRVLQDDGARTVVECTIDGFERSSINVDGLDYSTFLLPGETVHMTPGAPQLPTLRHSFMIPDEGAMMVRVLERETLVYPSGPVAPSKGHLKRTVDPASVPFEFGPAYTASTAFPEAPATLGEPYIFRDFRGAVLELNPLRYLPASQELEVTTRMVVEIVRAEGEAVNEIHRDAPPQMVDQEFLPLYATVFDNWSDEYYTPIPEPGRCLIISHPSLWSAATRLAEWKLQKGIPTMMLDGTTLGNDANLIKTYVEDRFFEAGGLTYVIIVGDVQQVPTLFGQIENAPSDVQYSRLVGTDFYPDLMVSRLSCQTLDNADYVVEKMIRYELNPEMGETQWFTKGTGIASAESGGTGLTDCQRVQLLENMLLDYTYVEVDRICDPTATKTMVFNALNTGSTMVNYIGHGSGTSWGTTGFNVTDIHNLNNDWKSCFLLDVACTNGQYTMNESFSEAWLRAGSMSDPKAGLGTYGSSLVCSWVPPCIMQNEANRLLVEEVTNTVGGICMGGIMEVLDTEGQDGRILFEEYNILGDCTIPLRTTVPMALALVHEGTYYVDSPTYDVTVTGVENALVSLYRDGVLYGSGYTDASGVVSVPLDVLPTEPMTLTLTVTAYNHETLVQDLPVEWASLAEMLVDNVAIADFGDGTVNGQIEAGETAELLLTLRNDGLEAATGLVGELNAITPGVTVTQPMANYGTVVPGDTGVGDQPYLISVDPTVADGTQLVFELAIDADAGQWDDGFHVTSHAPVFSVKWVHVDDATGDADGRLDAGETGDLLLMIENQGSGDAAGLSGHLLSGSLSLIVQSGVADLGDLASGGEGTLDPRFVLNALPSIVDNRYLLNVRFTGNNGVSQRASFFLPVGGWFDNVENGEGEWVHTPVTGVDEWHLSTDRNASPLGAAAWKFGSSEGGTYADDSDGMLSSPSIGLSGSGELRFSYWIDAELDGEPGVARDGGYVEMILGGETVLLTPDGGYPYTLAAGTSAPEGTGVFSGQAGWNEVVFDLEGYLGAATFVFHFVSDASGSGEGWYVDDVSVLGTQDVSAVDPIGPATLGLQLAAAPNPVVDRTDLVFQLPENGTVDLGIFDANGRRVATVASGAMDAGIHRVEWTRDAALESGVYFVRIQDGTNAKSQRIVLVK
ncbi:MAG: T9SS type A sorting domain-containing protein [Candidatus Eisenbacteria bacterium]|uniref:T9SS type A sorting domain-containing protein n=1 Tax=Eiseniibacteriota bacterium TaxID=2212470 RepID=A0A956NH40_UNCEI|nr:T9SS type A sorting domain-containing protein [Candidatus Eisenbacteria bacterium]